MLKLNKVRAYEFMRQEAGLRIIDLFHALSLAAFLLVILLRHTLPLSFVEAYGMENPFFYSLATSLNTFDYKALQEAESGIEA